MSKAGAELKEKTAVFEDKIMIFCEDTTFFHSFNICKQVLTKTKKCKKQLLSLFFLWTCHHFLLLSRSPETAIPITVLGYLSYCPIKILKKIIL